MSVDTKELENKITTYKPFEITTPPDYEKASLVLKETKAFLKVVDEKEKEVTAPLNEGIKKARLLFKPMKEKLNTVIYKLNDNMSTFRRKQEEEARKQQEEINKNIKEDDIFVPVVEPEIPKTEIKIRTNWKFKVIDKSKLKQDFLIPDEKSIGEFVRKFKDDAHKWIGAGAIEIYKEETSY